MINKKLLSFDRKALHYVGLNVLFQWLGMLCNVVLVMTVSRLIGGVFAGSLTGYAGGVEKKRALLELEHAKI